MNKCNHWDLQNQRKLKKDENRVGQMGEKQNAKIMSYQMIDNGFLQALVAEMIDDSVGQEN